MWSGTDAPLDCGLSVDQSPEGRKPEMIDISGPISFLKAFTFWQG
jgi:hypothetical protein